MRWLLIAAVGMGVAGQVRADEWTFRDTAIELVFVAVTTVDWLQTSTIPDRWNGHYGRWESNAILGEHPSHLEINAYFLGSIAGHALIAYVLPRPAREIWQAVGIGFEMCVVGRNLKMHVGLSVPW